MAENDINHTIKHVYLAGPEVFSPNAAELADQARLLTRAAGFEALIPIDNELPPEKNGTRMRALIFEKNVELIQRADFVIANLTPFRGPSADVGTVWEVGYAHGLGKPVWGFSHIQGDYRSRVQDDGLIVEDFGGFDNLMISESIESPLCPSLEIALQAAKRYFQITQNHKVTC